MRIVDHLIQAEGNDRVIFSESPNRSGPLAADTIIIHYTAGRDAESSVRSLSDPNVKASAHVVVARDGRIFQLIPFNVVAWHAGPSSYHFPDGTFREGFNRFSIGIEIDNAGILTKNGGVYTSWFGRNYEEKDVLRATHRNESTPKYWHRFTEIQIAVVEELCRVLIPTYDIKYILGHEEISPGRKVDPGPAFPLDKMRDRILKQNRKDDRGNLLTFPVNGAVVANKLNIRAQGNELAEKIAQPLPRGKRVRVLSEANGWYYVAVEIEGWVSGKYVDVDHT